MQAEVLQCAPAARADGRTASQLIRGVRRTRNVRGHRPRQWRWRPYGEGRHDDDASSCLLRGSSLGASSDYSDRRAEKQVAPITASADGLSEAPPTAKQRVAQQPDERTTRHQFVCLRRQFDAFRQQFVSVVVRRLALQRGGAEELLPRLLPVGPEPASGALVRRAVVGLFGFSSPGLCPR